MTRRYLVTLTGAALLLAGCGTVRGGAFHAECAFVAEDQDCPVWTPEPGTIVIDMGGGGAVPDDITDPPGHDCVLGHDPNATCMP